VTVTVDRGRIRAERGGQSQQLAQLCATVLDAAGVTAETDAATAPLFAAAGPQESSTRKAAGTAANASAAAQWRMAPGMAVPLFDY
jgi:arylsulfatase A-like enzyme